MTDTTYCLSSNFMVGKCSVDYYLFAVQILKHLYSIRLTHHLVWSSSIKGKWYTKILNTRLLVLVTRFLGQREKLRLQTQHIRSTVLTVGLLQQLKRN